MNKGFVLTIKGSLITILSSLCGFKALSLINDITNKQSLFFAGDGDGNGSFNVPIPTSGATSYSTYLKHYYDNLTTNFGMNYKGSCGYVGLGMLLSYFDSYFDGNLISSSYTFRPVAPSMDAIARRDSPGIIHDSVDAFDDYENEDISTWENEDYLDYYYDINDTSLHAKLITIGNDFGYVHLNNINPFATTHSQRINVLESYLENIVGLDDEDYSLTQYEHPDPGPAYGSVESTIVSNIIDIIDDNRPVLLSIDDTSPLTFGSGHIVVAYDYSYINNKVVLYCHPGLGGNNKTTHMVVSDYYDEEDTVIKSYLAIDFNYTATKGYNYGVKYFFQNTTSYYKYTSMFWQSGINPLNTGLEMIQGDDDYETE